MAAQIARRPRGRVTQVFKGAAREGAYRWLESPEIESSEVQHAAQRAAARRAAVHRLVFVPVDQTALGVTDVSGMHFGPLSTRNVAVSGLQAMSALLVAPDGVTLGLGAQAIWTRSWETPLVPRTRYQPVEDTETQRWLDVTSAVANTLAIEAPCTLPWFQLDRGGDATPVLRHLLRLGSAFTVRSSSNRRVQTDDGPRSLYEVLGASRWLGTYRLRLPATKDRSARTALVDVRARAVDLIVSRFRPGHGPYDQLPMTALEARERPGDDVDAPVLWRLLTNHPVTTLDQAQEVIAGYTMRWRVEEFHLAWKTGTCRIEDSLLRSVEAFTRWATILATVAIRAERLKHLSRETPNVPAETEFTRDEIDAVILLRRPTAVSLGASVTLGQLVRWIADIGGYTGKSSGGPPGIRVISRALDRVDAAAEALRVTRGATDL